MPPQMRGEPRIGGQHQQKRRMRRKELREEERDGGAADSGTGTGMWGLTGTMNTSGSTSDVMRRRRGGGAAA